MGSTLRGLAAGLSLSLAALCAGPLAAQTLDPRTMEWCDGRGQVPDDRCPDASGKTAFLRSR